MKKCTKCDIVKSLDDFAKKKGRKDGRQSACKSCQNAYHKARYATNEQYRKDRIESAKERSTKRHRYVYGLSQEEYDALKSLHDGMCHVCLEKPGVVVDHDHSCCGKDKSCGSCVRGILCYNCNVGLGLFKDRKDLLNKAVQYLGI